MKLYLINKKDIVIDEKPNFVIFYFAIISIPFLVQLNYMLNLDENCQNIWIYLSNFCIPIIFLILIMEASMIFNSITKITNENLKSNKYISPKEKNGSKIEDIEKNQTNDGSLSFL